MERLQVIEQGMFQTIGEINSVQASLSRLFPQVQWNKVSASPSDMGLSSYFGLGGGPEFQLLVEADGQVRMLTMSHCERSEVEYVARELGLVVIDEQSMELFGG